MSIERQRKLMRLLLRAMPIPFVPGPEIYDLIVDAQKDRSEVEAKVEKLLESMREAASVVSELEGSLQQRAEKLEALKSELQRLSQLAAVEEAKAAPILEEIRELSRAGRGRERAIGFLLNIAAGVLIFLLGAWLGPDFMRRAVSDSQPPETPSAEIGSPSSK